MNRADSVLAVCFLKIGVASGLLLVGALSGVTASSAQTRIKRPVVACRGTFAFTARRSVVAEGLFDRWRRHYCDASTCSMVLCHGQCNDSYERCPTLNDLNAAVLSDRHRSCAM